MLANGVRMTATPQDATALRQLSSDERLTVLRQLWRARVREFLQFDSSVARAGTAICALSAASVFAVMGRRRRAFELLTTAHRWRLMHLHLGEEGTQRLF